jgi:hypothetical protein
VPHEAKPWKTMAFFMGRIPAPGQVLLGSRSKLKARSVVEELPTALSTGPLATGSSRERRQLAGKLLATTAKHVLG